MILKYIVDKNSKYLTLKEILRSEFHMSKNLIIKLKQNSLIKLNNQSTFLDKRIQINDVITCNLDFKEESENIVPKNIPLNILYEDNAFLIINKEPGIPVHPSILHYETSLSNGVKYYFNKIGLHKKIRPVNRLDKDTSGIVIFAKNEYIQECLIKQMQNKVFEKKYLALLCGNLEIKNGTVNQPISRKKGSIIERCIDNLGAPSITNFKLIKNYNNFCLVEFHLETGRTHQIRVHSQYIGHPILGDSLYGKASNLISRQALHCCNLSFIHPISNKRLSIIAPIPNDMKSLI